MSSFYLRLDLSSDLFPSDYPNKPLYAFLTFSCYMPCQFHPPRIRHPNKILEYKLQIWDPTLRNFLCRHIISRPFVLNISLCAILHVHYMYVHTHTHEGVSKSFWTGRLQRELQMVQLSATRCSCFSIL
jgi:hypothetical protein